MMGCPYRHEQKGETVVEGFTTRTEKQRRPTLDDLGSEKAGTRSVLPTLAADRKALPIFSGVLDYFPNAIAAVAKLSKVGNDQHNPGEPLHWARGKSTDHADTIVRHLMERGTVDGDGVRHSTKAAWRALALLQEELEREEGAPVSRGSRVPV